ncbi:hypothetical protein WOLCODRAFT_163329 [Wolfiporia cocos MD-104 SS10]|uniref:Uncharacterized protein n=1 Tax=Wolfiporia cocos (strain MD-104) TaxID=742152 RepID=A0A2H3JZW8_WOLCO|nr:hypothetical protein WOLCODRAFT_163329 [Wolfiporia cocos MD-104 SS10]
MGRSLFVAQTVILEEASKRPDAQFDDAIGMLRETVVEEIASSQDTGLSAFAEYHNTQAKLRVEIATVRADTGGDIPYLNKLSYFDVVCRKMLCPHVPVHWLTCSVRKDMVLPLPMPTCSLDER